MSSLAESRDGLRDDGIGRIFVGHAFFETGDGRMIFMSGGQSLVGKIDGQHARALGGEKLGGGLSDAGGGTGNDGNTIFQAHEFPAE